MKSVCVEHEHGHTDTAFVHIYIYIYIYNSSVRTLNVVLETCREQWMIGTDGKRESVKSVLAIRHDDHDIYIYIYIYMCVCVCVCVRVCALVRVYVCA